MEIPRQILVQGDDAIALIPQKKPIVMVDILYECSPQRAVAGLTILSDNMFCEDGLFREPGIIEHIAQSVALKAGYEQVEKNAPPVTGYIGSVKNLVLHFLPSVGDSLLTTIELTHVVGNILVVHGKVECKGQVVATCEMKIVEQRP